MLGETNPRFNDLVGAVFGNLTALRWVSDGRWELRCACGTVVERSIKELRLAINPPSCPECRAGRSRVEIGQRFGRLVAVERIGTRVAASGKKKALWRFLCDCGGTTERTIQGICKHTVNRCPNCNYKRLSPRPPKQKPLKPKPLTRSRMRDLSGHVFGKLTAVRPLRAGRWELRCECGGIVEREVGELRRALNPPACTDCRNSSLIGQRFGRLVVVGIARRTGSGTMWRCQCDCGGVMEEIRTSHLKTVVNAGCKDCESERRAAVHVTHGGALGGRTRIYSIWKAMKFRCSDEANPYYGGKGIRVCEEWEQDFRQFRRWAMAHGYAPHLTIERDDPLKGYAPSNCQWITKEENSRRMMVWWRDRKAA